MILTILRIMYLRLRNNPVELLLVFVMPVAFFSIFAAIFSNGITTGNEKKLRVGWIVQHQTALGNELKDFLEQNSALECLSLITGSTLNDKVHGHNLQAISDRHIAAIIADAQRTGRYDLIIRLPRGFPEAISDAALAEPPPIHLVTDGQNPMALAMVTSVIQAFIAQKQSAWIAERLINSSSMEQTSGEQMSVEQQSAGNSRFPNSESPPRFWPDDPGVNARPMNHRPWSEPFTAPRQIDPRETDRLVLEKNPHSEFQTDFHTSGILAEADHIGSASDVLGLTLDSPRAPLFSMGEEPQHPIQRPVPPRGSQYGSLPNLPADSGQRHLDQHAPDEVSMQRILAGTSAYPQPNAPAANPLETSQATQPPPVDRAVLQIRVENPQSTFQENPRIAMYAAGIAVLFLLFSSTGNAATLLEEAETGTLDRIMVGKANIFHIIGGKWLGIFLLGMVQISVMFLWAEVIFKIQLWKHLDGFFVMTCCTSAATASLAILMATLCNSRPQLNAVSIVLILSMSAMGGSMIPRFVMSDRMKEIGQWTFNAWALDGYQKVFWYQAPLASLRTEVTVLLGSALVMGGAALVFSQRWQPASFKGGIMKLNGNGLVLLTLLSLTAGYFLMRNPPPTASQDNEATQPESPRQTVPLTAPTIPLDFPRSVENQADDGSNLQLARVSSVDALGISTAENVSDSCHQRFSVVGLTAKSGDVCVAVFETESGFPKPELSTKTLVIPKTGEQVQFLLELPINRPVAVAVFQDIDGNGKLTKSQLGIPSEPYGFSNNARGMFGPPAFMEAAFVLSSAREHAEPIEIKVR